MLQGDFYYRLEPSISLSRLGPYVVNGQDQASALSAYLWNCALSEALYPSLSILEIALRNATHMALTYRFGTSAWYDKNPPFLLSREAAAILDAKDELLTAGKVIEPDRVVASLRFGFWTGLLNSPYEVMLWRSLLPRVFPNLHKKLRTRDHVSTRLHGVRELRNRVFHHERIVHWEVGKLHAEATEAIGWINAQALSLLRAIDRFPQVLADGPASMRHKLLPPMEKATASAPPSA